jgi:hypothetical protein
MAVSSRQSQAYVVQQVYKLSPDTVIDRFRDAWKLAIKASPILRTRIFYIKGLGSMQVVLSKADEWASSNDLREYLQYDRTIDMCYNTPLSRFCLVHDASSREVYFVYTAHHSIFDGYSSSILFRDVTEFYQEPEFHLSTAPTFSRFVLYLQGIDASASHSFWQHQLTGSPSTTIFARHHSLSESRHESVSFGGITVKKSKRLSGLLATATTATLIRAAWALVMGQFSESDDVLFGATLSGREVPVIGVEDICGPTITTVPVRIRIDKNQRLKEFVEQVQQQATESLSHQHYGLQNMRLLNRKVLDLSTILVTQTQEEQDNTLCQGLMQPHDIEGPEYVVAGEQRYHKQPLVLISYLRGDGVGFKAVFNDLMISRVQVDKILRTLQHILQGLCYETRDLHIEDILWCDDEDRHQILSWNERDHLELEGSKSTVHELIKWQSHMRPESNAIRSWDADLTYAELDFQSSLLASYLGSLHVHRPSDFIIPVIFNKSAFMVIAMISVLKLGGAYTLLDPDQPTMKLRRTLHGLHTEILLVSPEHNYRVHTDVKHVVSLDIEFLNNLSLEVRFTEQIPVQGSAAAAIVFDSAPKSTNKAGVAVSHSSLCVLAETYAPYFRIGHGDKVLQLAPIESGAAT